MQCCNCLCILVTQKEIKLNHYEKYGRNLKGLAIATHLTAWMIWKHRNRCVFGGDQPSTRLLNDNIHVEAALWDKAGADGLRVILPTTWDVH
jgi:hypothetical protein